MTHRRMEWDEVPQVVQQHMIELQLLIVAYMKPITAMQLTFNDLQREERPTVDVIEKPRAS